mmetsp:Transcript_13386/g.21198  ORF Transcript_13386/g.21198 Transcript_13386/m.21198 type:complete len:80 (+) Transcript_13386:730-969(+)
MDRVGSSFCGQRRPKGTKNATGRLKCSKQVNTKYVYEGTHGEEARKCSFERHKYKGKSDKQNRSESAKGDFNTRQFGAR